jgi:hypothetical protein
MKHHQPQLTQVQRVQHQLGAVQMPQVLLMPRA